MAGGLDPVEQTFEANATAYLAALAAMVAAAQSFAAANRDAVASLAGLQAAIDAVHGTDVNIGVNVAEAAAAAEAAARLAQATAQAGEADTGLATAAAAAAVATDAQRASAVGTAVAVAGMAGGFQLLHLGLTVFGAQIAADAVGLTAFGIAATTAIAPVITSLSTLTTSYGQLDNYQKAAALSLQGFLNSLGGGSEAGVFTVFNQALGLVESHMSSAGGVTQQATLAFEDFFAMLKQQFASAGWASLFSRQASVVRADLDALFSVVNNLLGVVPALFHDFNSLGLFALGAVNDVLRLTAVIGNFDPALTKMAAGALAAAGVYHILTSGISVLGFTMRPLLGFLPTFSEMFAATGLGAFSLSGALKNLSEFGLVPTLSFMTGLAPAALAATAGLAAMAVGVGALIVWTNQYRDTSYTLAGALAAQDHATGDNVAGYQKLAAQLQVNIAQGAQYVGASRQLAANLMAQSAAQQQAAQSAGALRANFGYLNATYGLTQQQAMAAARATGVNLLDALTGSGQAAVEARSKIAAYELTMHSAAAVESEFALDMHTATDATQAWTKRLQALTTAFQVLSGPTLQAMSASAALKESFATLQQAARKADDQVGVNTQHQAALTAALATSAQAAFADSTALFNNTKSTQGAAAAAQAAIAPLITMKDEILDLGLKGKAAAALVAQLNQEIAALRSKTVTLTVIQQTIAYHSTLGPSQGHASGTPLAPSGAAMVGEKGPELVYGAGMMNFAGGERVVPAAQTASLLGGGGNVTNNFHFHIAGSVISEQDFQAKAQKAMLDFWTRNRGTGFAPYGHPLR